MKLPRLIFAIYLLTLAWIQAGDLPRPQEVRAVIRSKGIELSWTQAAPGTVVQIQRYVDGHKECRWTLPACTLGSYQMSGAFVRSMWTDTNRILGVTLSYRLRFKLGTDAGPWSIEVEAPR